MEASDSVPEGISPQQLAAFRSDVLGFYRTHGRTGMPWRETHDPYRVWVSEAMLQQTQVARVVPAYESWMERFPTVDALAAASTAEVLEAWQGLGYNRRAIALKRAAETISSEFGGIVPCEEDALLSLPGIGPATAAGIRAFAFGLPALYLETNVRSALLHGLLGDQDDVSDRTLFSLLDALMSEPPEVDVRTWYYALMDYGAHLKRTLPNPSRRSRHHARQSSFEGSHRQKRSRLLRAVMAEPGRRVDELADELGYEIAIAERIATELESEGFLVRRGEGLFIAE